MLNSSLPSTKWRCTDAGAVRYIYLLLRVRGCWCCAVYISFVEGERMLVLCCIYILCWGWEDAGAGRYIYSLLRVRGCWCCAVWWVRSPPTATWFTTWPMTRPWPPSGPSTCSGIPQYIMVYVSRLRRKAFSHNFLLGVIRVCSLHYIFTIVASTMYCN